MGGGTVFGPRPRTYGFKLNKKLKVLARKSALTYKAKGNNILVLEDFKLNTPKTKDYINILEVLSLTGKKTLFILPEKNANISLSSRNLQRTKVVTVDELNTYDLLNAESLILAEGSIKKIEDLLV